MCRLKHYVLAALLPILQTKVDRAYRLECFYMEADKTVSANLEVSMLTTNNIQDQAPMPVCTYSVRSGSRTGPEVRFTSIGAEIYHEWECDSDTHGMLVKDCHVEDGQGARHEIIDNHGCAIDPVIMPDLTYETQGTAKAWVEAHAFKFADRPNVHFQCVVQLCNKIEPECQAITPPTCGNSPRRGGGSSQPQPPDPTPGLPPPQSRDYNFPGPNRSRARSSPNRSGSSRSRLRTLGSSSSERNRHGSHSHERGSSSFRRSQQFQVLRHRSRREAAVVADSGPQERIPDLSGNELDLTSNSFVVFDIPDALPPEVDRQREDDLFVSADDIAPRAISVDNQLCLSPSVFGVLLSVVMLVFLLSTTVSVCFCMGRIRVDSVKIR